MFKKFSLFLVLLFSFIFLSQPVKVNAITDFSSSPDSITKTSSGWPAIRYDYTIDEPGADGSKVVAAVYWRKYINEMSDGDNWIFLDSWKSNGSGTRYWIPTPSVSAGTYQISIWSRDGNAVTGLRRMSGFLTLNAPVCPSSAPALTSYTNNTTLASYNNDTTLTWSGSGFDSYTVVVEDTTPGAGSAQYTFTGVTNNWKTIKPVPSGQSINQQNGQILTQGHSYSWWVVGIKSGCDSLISSTDDNGSFIVNKYPTRISPFAVTDAGADIDSTITFTGNLQYLNTSDTWTNFPNSDNESVKVINSSGTQLGDTAKTGNSGFFSINYTIGSSVIYANAVFNGDATYASTTTADTGSTLTIIPQTTQAYCLDNKPSGSTSGTMQRQVLGNVDFRICQNMWLRSSSTTAGKAWLYRMSVKNNTSQSQALRWTYENWICDPSGATDNAGHLSCADKRTPPGKVQSMVQNPIPANSVLLKYETSAHEEILQNTSLQQGSGTGYCGSAQVDLANPQVDLVATSTSPFWGYADGAYACNNSGGAGGGGTGLTIGIECSADPININTGDNTTWNVTQVTAGTPPYSYTWSGDAPLADRTGSSVTIAYTSSGTKNGSVTVTDDAGNTSGEVPCGSVTVAALGAPTVNLTAPPNSINPGQNSTLTWSTTNAVSCTQSITAPGGFSDSNWTGTKNVPAQLAASSNQTTAALPNTGTTVLTYTYKLLCVNSGGTTAFDTADIDVNPPAGATCTAPNTCITTGSQGASCSVQSGTCTAGKTCYSCPASSTGAWIQTTGGGDVHSNTRINTPGGP